MQEVSVVERLQTKIGKLVVALGVQCFAQTLQIELPEAVIEQPCLDTPLDEAREVLGIAGGHAGLVDFVSEYFTTNRVQQKARSDQAVGRIGLDQRTSRQNRGLVDFIERNAVINVLERLDQHLIGPNGIAQTQAGGFDQRTELALIERPDHIAIEHIDAVFGWLTGRRRLGQARRALLRPLFAIQNIGPGHLVFARAHQGQFNLVLNIFDMEGAAGRLVAHQRSDNRLGLVLDQLSNPRRCRALTTAHRQKGLGHRHRNLARLEAHDRAVTADDLEVDEPRRVRATVGDVGDNCGKRPCCQNGRPLRDSWNILHRVCSSMMTGPAQSRDRY